MSSAVLDTNVICSGLITPGGVPGSLLQAWRDGRFDLVTSEPILAELHHTLSYAKIRSRMLMSELEVEEFLDLMTDYIVANPRALTVEALTDKTDLKFLEVAATAEADYLVTGDSALLRLETYETTEIVTPRRFLTILELQTQL